MPDPTIVVLAQKCSSCTFWVPQESRHNIIGQCRRHAPIHHHRNYPTGYPDSALWPVTNPTDWCGDGVFIVGKNA